MSLFDLFKKKGQKAPQRPAPGQVGYVIPSGKPSAPVQTPDLSDPHYYGAYAHPTGGFDWFDPRAYDEHQLGGYATADSVQAKERFAALYREKLPEFPFRTDVSVEELYQPSEMRSWLKAPDFLFVKEDGSPLLAVLLADKNKVKTGLLYSLIRTKHIPTIRFFVDMANYESYVVGRTYDHLKKAAGQ